MRENSPTFRIGVSSDEHVEPNGVTMVLQKEINEDFLLAEEKPRSSERERKRERVAGKERATVFTGGATGFWKHCN